MKNDISDNSINGGIRIINKMEIVMPVSKGIVGRLCLMLTAFLGVVGSIMSFFTMYDIKVGEMTLLFYCVIFYLLFAVLLNLPGNFRLLVLPVLGIYGLLLYKNWDRFSTGFKLVYNAVYSQAYGHSGSFYTVRDKYGDSAELFAAFMICLLACMICISVSDKAGSFFGFMFTFPLVELGLYFGKSPRLIYGFMVFISWIMLIVLGGCGRFQRGGRLGFMRRGRNFSAQPGVRFHTAGMCSLIAFVLSILIFLLTFLVSAAAGYKRPESVDELRRNIKIAASEFSFDDLGDSFERLAASMGLNDDYKLYSNKLGRTGAVDFKNTTELTLNISDIPDDMIYLKGYTGSVYTGHEWEELYDIDFEDRKYMFERFDADGMHPQTMLAEYLRQRYPEDMNIITAEIKSKYKNEKYSYIPYGGIPEGDVTYEKDGDISTADKNDYKVKFPSLTVNEKNIRDILSGANYNISTYYNEYADFVSEKYLRIPNTDEMREIEQKFVSDDIFMQDWYGGDMYKCLEYIRDMLAKNAEYSLTPGATPEKDDFVSYFLNTSHKGYCVHFATAGVILARMAGIPARYAEGYVATKQDMESGAKQPDGGYSVSIKDCRGHAWAEIYYYGIGWVPFEFTPSSAAAFDDTRHSSGGSKKTTTSVTTKAKTTQTRVSSGQSTSAVTKKIQQTGTVTKQGTVTVKAGTEQKKMSIKVKLILMVLILLAAYTAYLVIRHIVRIKRRERIFGKGSSGEKITEAYLSVYGILEYYDVRQENMQYMGFAQTVSDEHPEIVYGDEFIKLTEMFLKVQLGDVPPDSSESVTAVNTYRKVFERVYKNADPIRKFIIKYIKNL